MNKKEYLAKRNELYNKAQEFINGGKVTEANKLMNEIEKLDEQFKAEATAAANLEALNKNTFAVNCSAPVSEKSMMCEDKNSVLTKADITDSIEYRNAFKSFIVNHTAMPAKFFNSDQVTKTSDAGAVIPTEIVKKIIDKMSEAGKIFGKVTKTNLKGGISYPKAGIKPVATWVAEGETSDKQKLNVDNIIFSYYKLRCAVSVTLEAETVTLDIFESYIADKIYEAMLTKLEDSIINGDGSGKPKGILNETVPDGQNVDIVKGQKPTYQTLIDAEAALPEEYESTAEWIMSKKTFMSFVGMTDSSGQPIARVNYGLNGRIERYLLGRTVNTVPYVTGIDAPVTSDTVVAFMFDLSDYAVNTNYSMVMKQYEDNDTDDTIRKSIMLADGKALRNDSLVTVTLKNA